MDKTGFVSVIGRPNVGKSTLLNRIIGEKISIISNKAQTTRENIHLIYSDDDSQIIFVDTPGMQRPRNALQEHMLKDSKSTINDMDVIIYMVDTSDYIGPNEKEIIDFLKNSDRPIILCVNKIDTVPQDKLIEVVEMYNKLDMFDEIVPISASEDINIDRLMMVIKDYLPYGPRYYPDDQITNKTEKFIIEELIREKALRYLKEEVPHGVFINVDSINEDNNNTEIDATIYVERNTHRGIVIGKGGSMIKRIREDSEKDISNFLDQKVSLHLWVKVEPNWRDKEDLVRRFGF